MDNILCTAVHLDFCLPFGVKEYNVSESAEYLEVCIKVASTGSYEALTSPIQVYISYEDISATGTYSTILSSPKASCTVYSG